jgi:hypothetical protein
MSGKNIKKKINKAGEEAFLTGTAAMQSGLARRLRLGRIKKTRRMRLRLSKRAVSAMGIAITALLLFPRRHG